MERTEPELLKEMIDSLNQACGATSQLVHACGQPIGFIIIRDALDLMKDAVVEIATKSAMRSLRGVA